MALAGQRFLRFLGLTALWAEGCGGGFAAIYNRVRFAARVQRVQRGRGFAAGCGLLAQAGCVEGL